MSKYDLTFSQPYMNAAGTLGFAPEKGGPLDLAQLGAFVTNPVSLGPRTPAQGRRFAAYPGGFMLHTGYPNPGFKAVLRRCAARWAHAPLPVIVHLLSQAGDDLPGMLRQLEGVEGVLAVELGLPPNGRREDACAMLDALQGELPLIARAPLEQAVEFAPSLVEHGAAAVSLGPARGRLPVPGQKTLEGRLYGPSLLPLALEAVQQIDRQGLPVIGAGGVYSMPEAQAMLEAGALAVQFDAVLWSGGME
jgi:dihydroorotate dehydrogenase (NAD+) catalytic subunit